MNDKCEICDQPFGAGKDEGMSKFAAYGGLPPLTCECCFEANDFSINNTEQLKFRSLQRRVKNGGTVEGVDTPAADWKTLEDSFALLSK